jgi:peptide/nickel transport system substrate-binding protein
MEEQRTTLHEALFKHRSLPILRGISSFIATRRPSDKLIIALFGILVLIASLWSLLKLEQSILVTEPAYGGSLTEGSVGAPRFINPILAISDTDQDLSSLTYSGLMGYGPKGTLVPILAKSYSVSSDGKTYTFILRDNAKFSDGSPVTANDIVFTVHKAQDPALKSPQLADWSNVTVTAVDAKTVKFTLPAPYAPFLENTTLGILPSGLWNTITDDEFPFSDLMVKPVGAGPFVPGAITRDGNGGITHYTLTENKNYVLGRPYLDSFKFVFFDDQSALQTAVDKGSVQSASGVIGKTYLKAPYARVFAVFFNPGESASIKDIAVREALSLAIDRTALIKSILGGYGTALTGPVPAGTGIEETPAATSTPAQLLLKDGFTQASSTGAWTDSSGNTLSITLKTSNAPELTAMAQAIQTDWQTIGIKTSLQFYAPGDLSQEVIRNRSFQALLFGMVIGKGDDLYDFWSSKERSAPGLNLTGYNNSAVDNLLTKLRTESDPVARIKDLATINETIAASYPAAFIESPDFVYVVPKDLKGVILPPITSPADRFATVATWYRRTESVWPFLARAQ